ncbi:MAG: hypothetical protein SPL71_12120, partial [Oribacterium sp.]|nr:hypothetical protein [Oribacterium sp.]
TGNQAGARSPESESTARKAGRPGSRGVFLLLGDNAPKLLGQTVRKLADCAPDELVVTDSTMNPFHIYICTLKTE